MSYRYACSPALLFVGGAVILSNCGWALIFDLGSPGGPLSATDPCGGWPIPVLFGLVLCDPGGPCVLLNLIVLWWPC